MFDIVLTAHQEGVLMFAALIFVPVIVVAAAQLYRERVLIPRWKAEDRVARRMTGG